MSNNKINNKVYYGEYSLKHWINLILKKNIVLPEYQRSFVWSEDKVKKLIETFIEERFVPPVTIGALKKGDDFENLIIDGQQRLTSILLAYLEYFPNKQKFNELKKIYLNENNDEDVDEDVDVRIEWTFEDLLKLGKNKNEIVESIIQNEHCTNEFYNKLDWDKDQKQNLKLDENFFKNHFLGFSYLVPYKNDKDDTYQKRYFSSVFRNTNILGSTLSLQESRRSLYYLENDMEDYFEPKFLKGKSIDFIRYLALLSDYNKDEVIDNIAKGYSKKMEQYYEEYIYSTIWDENPNRFSSMSEIFEENHNYKTRLNNLNTSLEDLKLLKKYNSIIEQDMYLFGIRYYILFQNKEVDTNKKDSIERDITKKIEEYKQKSNYPNEGYHHIKNPASLKYLRERIKDSIDIYKEYIKNE